jgi:hypothetical protein
MSEVDLSPTGVLERRASGHEITAGGPAPVEPLGGRAYGPAGTSVVATVTDLLRFAAVHLEDVSLAHLRTVHAQVPIHGWLDAWCLGWAQFDWAGDPVWGWDGVVNGERSILRILPDQLAAVALMMNCGTGRAMYRSLFADLMEPLFGVRFPPLVLGASPGAAGDLRRFAGVYAWPDQTVEVEATPSGLVVTRKDGEAEALALDERTFLVDALDPDTPTMTFGGFDAAGRPGVLYLMIWGLPRLAG